MRKTHFSIYKIFYQNSSGVLKNKKYCEELYDANFSLNASGCEEVEVKIIYK